MSIKDDYVVLKVDGKEEFVLDSIMNKHYAQRRPSISYAFVLYDKTKDREVGVLTYGKPASNSLCVGVCGKEYSKNVYELNRLFIEDCNVKNLASYFISESEKQLSAIGNFIIVSYSDKGMSHNGYVYQASNFIYTGSTKERTDKYTPNGKHSRHYTDEYNHLRKVRTSKNRYVKFIGNKRFKKNANKNLKYDTHPYPKSQNKKYKVGDRMMAKIYNKETGVYYYE